jgi:NAD(P)-dependent dehydrogenase (short-subunit alcohol dehydrogenase family)
MKGSESIADGGGPLIEPCRYERSGLGVTLGELTNERAKLAAPLCFGALRRGDHHVPPGFDSVRGAEHVPLAIDDALGLVVDDRLHEFVLVGKVMVHLRAADFRCHLDVFQGGRCDPALVDQGCCLLNYSCSGAFTLSGEPRPDAGVVDHATMLAPFEFDSPVGLCHSELHNPVLQERTKQRMTDLRGKTALVTGSTSGIGKATAIALAARGAHVLVVGRNEQRAKDVVAEIEGSGGSAAFRLTTLSDLESAKDLVEWATEAGDGHVDILINNAGVALLGPSSAATEAEFEESFALNVKVPFFLVAALAPAMAERGWGSIVNVSTMVASFGQPGMAMYGASRAALELLTKAWAAEYGPSGVRVNAVAPGPTRTRMMEGVPEEMVNHLAALAPAGRVAEPEELAAAIVFLASEDASFVHGVTLAVDGGRIAT